MNDITSHILTNNDSFTCREFSLLFNVSKIKTWEFFRSLERYGIVKPCSVKASVNGSVTYWRIIDKKNFLKQVEERIL